MVCLVVSLIVVEDVDALCDLEVDGADAGEQHRLDEHSILDLNLPLVEGEGDVLEHADILFWDADGDDAAHGVGLVGRR